jgi:hypothetical protein
MKKMLQHVMGMGLMLVLAGGLVSTAAAATSTTPSTVDALDTDTWSVAVTAGEILTIVVHGDGDTDLDLSVMQNGQVLGIDDDNTDYCVVHVRALRTGRLTAEIRNLGDVYNRYTFSVRRN